MKRKTIIASLLSVLLIAALSCALARELENWSYERLFEESDLVAIVLTVKSEDSADRTKDNPWKIEFTGVNTKFDVLHVLKGKPQSKLTVLHYKTDERIENGPLFVSFRVKGQQFTLKDGTKVETAGPATYLLFLKKRGDGRFEPTSGHTDPALSARELTVPMNMHE